MPSAVVTQYFLSSDQPFSIGSDLTIVLNIVMFGSPYFLYTQLPYVEIPYRIIFIFVEIFKQTDI